MWNFRVTVASIQLTETRKCKTGWLQTSSLRRHHFKDIVIHKTYKIKMHFL